MKEFLKIGLYFILLVGCVSPFEVDTSAVVGQVVITGRITNLKEQEPIQIEVTSTSGVRPPIRNAIVKLVENNTLEILLSENTPGKYFFPPNMIGKPGNVYQLKVSLPDGRTFTSIPQVLPKANGLGKSKFEVINKGVVDAEGTIRVTPFLKIISNFSLEKKGLYIRWDVFETYYLSPTNFPDPFNTIPPPCYVTNSVNRQNIRILNGKNFQETTFNSFEIAEREIDQTFAEKHIFSIYQTSMTVESYDYWRKVQLLLSQSGSIFDTPPAPIEGNIYSEGNSKEYVLGFFEAANISINRVAVFPYDIPFLVSQPCTYEPGKPDEFYTKECLDCLSLPNSTLEQPDWFLD